MKFDPIEAGKRFETICRLLNYSADRMAEAADISRRSVFNYFKKLNHNQALQISRSLGIPIETFYSDAPLETLRDIGYCQKQEEVKKNGARIAIFDGSNTGLLTRFLVENEKFILHHCKVYVTGKEANEAFAPQQIRAEFDGYRRTIIIDENTSIGGINAVIEDVKLNEIRIEVQSSGLDKIHNMSLPFLIGSATNSKIQHAISLANHHNPLDAIACCSLIPCSGTLAVILGVLDEYRQDMAVCASCFDNLKKFKLYLIINRSDGVQVLQICKKYIDAFINEEDRMVSVSFAVEALPFCVATANHEWKSLESYLLGVEGKAHTMQHGADIALAANAARNFLFLTTP